jgi:hypothetical protein
MKGVMKKRGGWLAGVLAGVMVLGGGYVVAQDAPVDPLDLAADEEEPAAARVELSPSEMRTQATHSIAAMQDNLKRIVQLQETARRQKDVIKLNCVNDKLLQVKQLLNIAESANTNLQEMIARADEEGRYHEFGRIQIAHQQATVLATEAENCVGEDFTFFGETEVTVDKPTMPDDFDFGDGPNFPDVELPPLASPFI